MADCVLVCLLFNWMLPITLCPSRRSLDAWNANDRFFFTAEDGDNIKQQKKAHRASYSRWMQAYGFMLFLYFLLVAQLH